MRIFIGIDLDHDIRERMARFIEGVSGFAPEARFVSPESLHVTLKFIGEQKPEQVDALRQRLHRIEAASFAIRFAGSGFFPTPLAPRVFWIGIEAGPVLAQLAGAIDAATAELGVAREERPYSPHLTLARARGGSGAPRWRQGDGPNSVFAVLQKRLAALGELDFGTMAAGKFILYQSRLSPKGSQYTKLESFPLRPQQ